MPLKRGPRVTRTRVESPVRARPRFMKPSFSAWNRLCISGRAMAARIRSLIFCGAVVALVIAGTSCRAREQHAGAPLRAPKIAATEGGLGAHGGRKATDWVPAEFKKGAGRWRDTGLYVDGKPVGVVTFGELPIGLEPVWIEDEVSAEKNYGDDSPGYRIIKQRHYRFTDYLQAVGVDLKRVREVHVYGPQPTEVIIVSGAELRKRGDGFMFRFGSDVYGKAIPVVPANFGNGVQPDKISAVTVYVRRPPPKLIPDQGMELDGEIVEGIPYYGEPLRGGVRVYFEDRLATIIKRNQLQDAGDVAVAAADGHVRWRLLGFLEQQGVDTRKIVEGWVIRHEQRRERLTLEALETATFEADPQAKGEILLRPGDGSAQIRAQGLTLHSKHVTLPQILPDEDPSGVD